MMVLGLAPADDSVRAAQSTISKYSRNSDLSLFLHCTRSINPVVVLLVLFLSPCLQFSLFVSLGHKNLSLEKG